MTFDNPLLFFFCALGVFNGFVISLYFLFFSKQKPIQNKLFGLLVFLLSLRIGKSLFILFSIEPNHIVIQIGLSACFLIGVSLYYYLKASIDNVKRIPKIWKWHFLGLFALVTIIGLIKPNKHHPEFWGGFVMFIYITWGLYTLASALLLKHIIRQVLFSKEKSTSSELWLFAIFLANLLIYSAYILGYFKFYLVGTLTFSIVFYGLLLFLLFNKNRKEIFEDTPQKYASKTIEEDEVKLLSDKLHNVMIQKELYKNSDIKLNDVARELKVTPHKLSQLLNQNLQKSFAAFVSEYRIEEAKKLLIQHKNYTLEVIGFESGFSSKSTFYAAFKKLVGLTPSEYKKQHS